MNVWAEYDGDDNELLMIGSVIDGECLECMVGESYPVNPLNASSEVDFGQYYDRERNRLLDAGYAPAVDLQPRFKRKR